MRKNGYNSIARGIRVVLVLMLGLGVSCGLTSCFKKKKAAQAAETLKYLKQENGEIFLEQILMQQFN